MAARVEEYKKLHAVGLTTVRHPGISPDDYRLLQTMQRQGRLTMRVNALLRPGGSAAAVAKALDESGLHQGDGDAWLRVGGVKLAVDGGFEGGLMREPYEEPWGEHGSFRGLQTVERDGFIDTVRTLNQRGWRVATHAVGDAGIDLVLDAYERANADQAISGRRWSIEHAFIGRPDHLPRIKDTRARAGRAEPPLSGRPEPRALLGPGARRADHAGPDVSRRRTAGLLRHRRAGRPVSTAVDALPLHHAGHHHRWRARARSARDARGSAPHGDDRATPG